MVKKVRKMVEEDPKSIYIQIQEQPYISAGSANRLYTILHENLSLHLICSRLIPQYLIAEQKLVVLT